MLTGNTSNVVFDAQWYIHNVLTKSTSALNDQACRKIGAKLEGVELALKEDIGVFAVEFEDKRRLRSYNEVPGEPWRQHAA